MEGKIFNIQKFCINDGPGIRTVVFLKGCPLKCIWCHNPESQSIENEIMYSVDKCRNCFKCVGLCDKNCHIVQSEKHIFDREKCVACGKCTNPSCNALKLSGYKISTDDIIKEVLKDRYFYESSGGGLTVSGGEPLYQSSFCLELLSKAKEYNLNVCLETCGYVPKNVFKKAAEFVDTYLFDIKELNDEKHKEFTGVSNTLILENLKFIDKMGKDIIFRCPIIPGYNDNIEHFDAIARLANKIINVKKIEVEPYHNIGEGKYDDLGRGYSLSNVKIPGESQIDGWIENIQINTKVKVEKA